MPGCAAPDGGQAVDGGSDVDAHDEDVVADDAGADADGDAQDNDAGSDVDAGSDGDVDAGSDGEVDAASDGAPAKSPCADNNGGADCSPTEQRFVAKSADCYACMVNAGCLDDSLFGDSGHECGDLAGNAVSGAKAGTPKSDLCLATVDCILNPVNLCAASDVNVCYCGSLGAGNACATAATGADGACFQREVDGLEHFASDSPSAILPDYTDLTRGAGIANQLFVCAKSNGCDALCAQ